MLLVGSGLAVLCVGRFADSSLNGFNPDDLTALNTAVRRLEQIPSDIGNWSSRDEQLSEREQEVAGISGYVRRQYDNARIGYTVHLTVLCGPSGPMSVHPPTACFEGVGYQLISGPTRTVVENEDDAYRHEFNRSAFREGDTSVPEIIRVFWGWGTTGEWRAPASPRFDFRGEPYLYKIYVTDSRIESDDARDLPQIETFLADALPVITSALSGETDGN